MDQELVELTLKPFVRQKVRKYGFVSNVQVEQTQRYCASLSQVFFKFHAEFNFH